MRRSECFGRGEVLSDPEVIQQKISYSLGKRGDLTMMKLLNQLEHVLNATPLARSDDGKISERIISRRLLDPCKQDRTYLPA